MKYTGYILLAVCAPVVYAVVVFTVFVDFVVTFVGRFYYGRVLIHRFRLALFWVYTLVGYAVSFFWWLAGFSRTFVLQPRLIYGPDSWQAVCRFMGYGFVVSIGLYYAAVVEWMHFFDQYLCLDQLSFFAYNRGWDWGNRKWKRAVEFAQYEHGFVGDLPSWWTGFNLLMARIPYFFSTIDGWSTTLICHPEFLYLVVSIAGMVLYVVDHGRIFEAAVARLFRLVSVVVFMFRLVALIPEGANVISGDTLFLQMYVTGGWWEVLASCVISAILVMGLSVQPANHHIKVFYIFLGTVAVLAYAAVSMPFCNDFLSIFLTSELFSIGGLTLFIISTDRTSNTSVFKYTAFNVVGGILLLYGCLVIYGVTSLSDISRMLCAAPYSGTQFELGFIVFVLGLLFKLCSAPVLVVLEKIYTKLCVNLLVVLVVAVEVAYAGLLFRTLLIGLTGARISVTDQPALMSVLLFAAASAGFASTRTNSFIAGTLYSSVQHISFMLSILVVSYN